MYFHGNETDIYVIESILSGNDPAKGVKELKIKFVKTLRTGTDLSVRIKEVEIM